MAIKKTARTVSKTKHEKVGVITHYFNKVGVAVVKLQKPLNKGDKIRIQSDTPDGLTNFAQTVTSMQHNHKPVLKALKGKEIGLKVRDRVREKDLVYKIV